jgi:hypothetical protein
MPSTGKKPKPPVAVTVTTGNTKTGQYSSETRTPLAEDSNKKSPAAERAAYQQQFLDKLGVYKEFLDQYPEIKALIQAAMKDYKQGDKWDLARFTAAYNNTQYAKDRSKAEEEFDLAMGGPNADTYNKKVADMTLKMQQDATRLGISLTPQEAEAEARRIVRSNLSQQEVDTGWASKYGKAAKAAEAAGMPGAATPVGTVGLIQSSLKDQARKYGLSMDSAMIQRLTGEALGQGERWNDYVTSQGEFFKQQAKLMYPKAAGLLDSMNLEQIAEPYFQTAANVLGVSSSTMDLTDPKWAAFLNGADGPLSKDEWVRVLRTDSKYGFDKSDQARSDYARLGDELLSAFGMA